MAWAVLGVAGYHHHFSFGRQDSRNFRALAFQDVKEAFEYYLTLYEVGMIYLIELTAFY